MVKLLNSRKHNHYNFISKLEYSVLSFHRDNWSLAAELSPISLKKYGLYTELNSLIMSISFLQIFFYKNKWMYEWNSMMHYTIYIFCQGISSNYEKKINIYTFIWIILLKSIHLIPYFVTTISVCVDYNWRK